MFKAIILAPLSDVQSKTVKAASFEEVKATYLKKTMDAESDEAIMALAFATINAQVLRVDMKDHDIYVDITDEGTVINMPVGLKEKFENITAISKLARLLDKVFGASFK